jgi:Kef-type K+ transport system membrane component KefB
MRTRQHLPCHDEVIVPLAAVDRHWVGVPFHGAPSKLVLAVRGTMTKPHSLQAMNNLLAGILVWGGVAVVSTLVTTFIRSCQKVETTEGWVVLVSVVISDVIVRVLLGLIQGFAKVLMWLLISFIWVGLISFVVCLLAGLPYDRGLLRFFR